MRRLQRIAVDDLPSAALVNHDRRDLADHVVVWRGIDGGSRRDDEDERTLDRRDYWCCGTGRSRTRDREEVLVNHAEIELDPVVDLVEPTRLILREVRRVALQASR
jgi:hypothetical protein